MTVTFKVKLEGSDGRDYVQTIEGFKQRVGICELKREIEILRNNEDGGLEVLLARLEAIEYLLIGELKEHYQTELFNVLDELPTDKSFRGWELRTKIDAPSGHMTYVLMGLDGLVDSGAIEKRGNGWYRRKF